jgi:pyruvate dehydrogenase E2 component (dihydrolipoamide acetyltransferase)
MPALGMAQDTGKLIAWLKLEGEQVEQGEILMEIETDKATVEIEAPASGILRGVSAEAGEDVPVGETIAWILAPGEAPPGEEFETAAPAQAASPAAALNATPLARKIAEQHRVDLNRVRSDGGRIHKKDVLEFIEHQAPRPGGTRLQPASPKARRLAAQQGFELQEILGSGPGGAVLAEDVLAASARMEAISPVAEAQAAEEQPLEVSSTWQRMAERVTQSWTSVPHFYLQRETNATRLIAWRESAQKRTQHKLTFTDLLVKLAAAALKQHPRLSARWENGRILSGGEINIGLAMAVDEGLVVPVVHAADRLSLGQIAERRQELVERARAGKLRLDDLQGGTFTISNLGMYGVDVFNAIINPPQAALLAVGRIAERVVPVNGQPAVQPMMTLSLSCDHRAVDGARGAQFLQTLAELIEEPLGLLE